VDTSNWLSIIIAIFAALVSLASLYANLRSASRRELLRWKREMTVKTTSEIIALSGQRQEFFAIRMDDWDLTCTKSAVSQFTNLSRQKFQLEIVGERELLAAADRIMELQNVKLPFLGGPPKPTQLDSVALTQAHQAITDIAARITCPTSRWSRLLSRI
jgi:hypothetical protein